MSYDYDEFLTYFPEFSSHDETKVNRLIDHVIIIDNEFKGISKSKRKLAIYLKVAHNISLMEKNQKDGTIAPVKSLSSKNDKAEFAISEEQKGFGLESTIYGKFLENLLYNDLSLPVGGLY